MAWYRGLEALSTTPTGRRMIGGALAVSAGAGVVLHRKGGVGVPGSVASGAALGLGQIAAITWFGERLMRAGENLAVQSGLAADPQSQAAPVAH